MKKPDILIFFSDQHNAALSGFEGDKIVRTPNIDKLAAEGTVFNAAYTSCPLCVPARTSFMTGQLSEKTGIYTNEGAIPVDQATFIHSLAAEGYETVLCGRMHFMGEDQRHGFTKRLVGDMTPLIWGRGGDKRADLGPYVSTLANRALKVVGGGTSPVLEYDRSVISAALNYLAQDHEKPQCIVVGTYGPHHTYVAPPELFKEYLDKVPMPAATEKSINYEYPYIKHWMSNVPETTILKVRAAYYGMITHLDSQLGEVREQWKAYLQRMDRKGIFVYISDHGDQIGERGIFGKQTFFDSSARIPMIFEGDGVRKGSCIKQPVSLIDVGPTLCAISGAQPPPDQDGKSLASQLITGLEEGDRAVISEYVMHSKEKRLTPGRMLRKGKWKYISYVGYEKYDLLFNIEDDPNELHNCTEENPDIAKELHDQLYRDWKFDSIIDVFQKKEIHHHLLSRWGAAVDVPENERWPVSEEARKLPIIT